jgi:5-(carboxyamino)imidazole ribonucleotide synthase
MVQPLPPGATIGILGGGQLGRMLGLAARAMGYRMVVLDPDPACPAAAVADRVVVGAYDDRAAARELAAGCDVATYELEHVDPAVVAAVAGQVPVWPGLRALELTQDRLAERRFLAALGIPVTPWREVSTAADVNTAAASLGYPLRLKAPFGGYDGRSQVRIAGPAEVDAAFDRLARPAGGPLLAEAEVDFAAELSVVVARGSHGASAAFPVAANVHADGILATTLVPAAIPAAVATRAIAIASQVAASLDAIGVITAELFLLRDGSLSVNELAPRVHNSGHWTIEGARTSQFEQHVRAICGLPLGDPSAHGPAAMVNLLGTGALRAARLEGLAEALADPLVHVHVYAKQQVFERRKMGHVMVTGTATNEEALARATAARDRLRWT